MLVTVADLLTDPRAAKIVTGGVMAPCVGEIGRQVQALLASGTLDEVAAGVMQTLWNTTVGYATGPAAGMGTPAWHGLAYVVPSTGAAMQPVFRRRLRKSRDPKSEFFPRNMYDSDVDRELEAAAEKLLEDVPSLGSPVLDVATSLARSCGLFMGGAVAGDCFGTADVHPATAAVLAYVGSGELARANAAARAAGFTPVFAPCESFTGQRQIRLLRDSETGLYDAAVYSDYDGDPWGRHDVDLRMGSEPLLWGMGTCLRGGAPSWGVAHPCNDAFSRDRNLDNWVVPAFGYTAGYYPAVLGGAFGACSVQPALLGSGPATSWNLASRRERRARHSKRGKRNKHRSRRSRSADEGSNASESDGADADTDVAKREPRAHKDEMGKAVKGAIEWVGECVFRPDTDNVTCGTAGPWGVPRRELTLAATPSRVCASSPLCVAKEGAVFTYLPLKEVDDGVRELASQGKTAWKVITDALVAFLPTEACVARGMGIQVTTHNRRYVVVTSFHESPLDSTDVLQAWWAAAATHPNAFISPQDVAAAARLKFPIPSPVCSEEDSPDDDDDDEDEDDGGAGKAKAKAKGKLGHTGSSLARSDTPDPRQLYVEDRSHGRARGLMDVGAGAGAGAGAGSGAGAGAGAGAGSIPGSQVGTTNERCAPIQNSKWRTWKEFNARSELRVADLGLLGAKVANHLAAVLKKYRGFGSDTSMPPQQAFYWNQLKEELAPTPCRVASYRIGVGAYLDPKPGEVYAQCYGARWGWRLAPFAPTHAPSPGSSTSEGRRSPEPGAAPGAPGVSGMTWSRYETEVAGALSVRGPKLECNVDLEHTMKAPESLVVGLKLPDAECAPCIAASLPPDHLTAALTADTLYQSVPGVVLPFWDPHSYVPTSALVVVVAGRV